MDLVWDAGALIGIKIPMADQLTAHNILFIRRGASESASRARRGRHICWSYVDARS